MVWREYFLIRSSGACLRPQPGQHVGGARRVSFPTSGCRRAARETGAGIIAIEEQFAGQEVRQPEGGTDPPGKRMEVASVPQGRGRKTGFLETDCSAIGD